MYKNTFSFFHTIQRRYFELIPDFYDYSYILMAHLYGLASGQRVYPRENKRNTSLWKKKHWNNHLHLLRGDRDVGSRVYPNLIHNLIKRR